MKISRRLLPAVVAAAWCALPGSALACATCFGQSDEPMARGMNMGIFTLLLVIMSVLVGIAGFFFYIIRRAARMESALNPGDTQRASLTLPAGQPTN